MSDRIDELHTQYENARAFGFADLEASAIDELIDIIKALRGAAEAARIYMGGLLVDSLEGCCPHDQDGNIIRDKMDEQSVPMIEDMETLLAKIDAALARLEVRP